MTNTLALQVQGSGAGPWDLVWSSAAKGMTLQQSPTLVPADWQPVPMGSTNRMTVRAAGGTMFYRLTKP